jgi:hypothetical protein
VVSLSSGTDFKVYRSLLATAAALFGRADFKKKALAFDEKSFWILGFKGMKDFSNAARTGVETRSFNKGGYYILREGDLRLIFDCGPLGYLSIAAHGHADALSFVLDYQGRPIFVDRGTYAYHVGKDWRDYFRGTAAHNTLRIDGQDQSVIGGNFMWLEKAQSELLEQGPDLVRGRHNGYRRLKDPVIHEREIRYDKNAREIVIMDRVLAKGGHRVEQFFHLDPRCTCEEGPGNAVTIRHAGVKLVLRWDEKIQSGKIYKASTSPTAGWHSPGYDVKIPAVTLCGEMQSQGNTELKTTIRLS